MKRVTRVHRNSAFEVWRRLKFQSKTNVYKWFNSDLIILSSLNSWRLPLTKTTTCNGARSTYPTHIRSINKNTLFGLWVGTVTEFQPRPVFLRIFFIRRNTSAHFYLIYTRVPRCDHRQFDLLAMDVFKLYSTNNFLLSIKSTRRKPVIYE